jgi:hypothetical protein
MPDPKPNNIRAVFNRGRSVMNSHANRPIHANLLEMELRVPRIGLQQLEVLVGELLDVVGERTL